MEPDATELVRGPADTEADDVPKPPPAKKTRGPNRIQKEKISVKFYNGGDRSHTATSVIVTENSEDNGGSNAPAGNRLIKQSAGPTGGGAASLASRVGRKRSAPAEQDDVVQTHEDVLAAYMTQLNEIPGGKPGTAASRCRARRLFYSNCSALCVSDGYAVAIF